MRLNKTIINSLKRLKEKGTKKELKRYKDLKKTFEKIGKKNNEEYLTFKLLFPKLTINKDLDIKSIRMLISSDDAIIKGKRITLKNTKCNLRESLAYLRDNEEYTNELIEELSSIDSELI